MEEVNGRGTPSPDTVRALSPITNCVFAYFRSAHGTRGAFQIATAQSDSKLRATLMKQFAVSQSGQHKLKNCTLADERVQKVTDVTNSCEVALGFLRNLNKYKSK
ncbi:MAG: hypothetical protein S4CHLAM20_12330 [Chlamydiia bacterium]|nr:hypothetical protein [Chlamydiia bacterium]